MPTAPPETSSSSSIAISDGSVIFRMIMSLQKSKRRPFGAGVPRLRQRSRCSCDSDHPDVSPRLRDFRRAAMSARCSRRSRPAQREWQRSSRRRNHQRLPPLRMALIVRPNASAATKISQFPLQRYWRGVARLQTDEKGSSNILCVRFGSFAAPSPTLGYAPTSAMPP
jgi:hypothetical protein